MTDTTSLIGSISTFAALMAGISIAVERAVEMIKGAVPFLSNNWPKYDSVRAAIVQFIAAAAGAVIASQMPDQVKNAIPAGLGAHTGWQLYVVIGLISSGGSGAWNQVLDILGAVKAKQVALTALKAVTTPPAAAPAAKSAAGAGA